MKCENSFTRPNCTTDSEPSPHNVLSHRLTKKKKGSQICTSWLWWAFWNEIQHYWGPLHMNYGFSFSGGTLVKYETYVSNHHINLWFNVNVWLAGVVVNIDNEPTISTTINPRVWILLNTNNKIGLQRIDTLKHIHYKVWYYNKVSTND